MITHEELSRKLYEAILTEGSRQTGLDMMEKNKWENETDSVKRLWSAVADAAWELVKEENAIWAEVASQREEALRELVVEFMNRAEEVIA